MIYLRDFLKATLDFSDDDLYELEIKNPYLEKIDVDGKEFIVDLRIVSKTGIRINVEMQVQKSQNFINRMTAYNAAQFLSQIKKGDSIHILNFIVQFRLSWLILYFLMTLMIILNKFYLEEIIKKYLQICNNFV